MVGGFRLTIVLAAGVLVGALGLGAVLVLSELQISATPWSAGARTAPVKPGKISPLQGEKVTPKPIAPDVAPPAKAPNVPQGTATRRSLLYVGPVPGAVATEIVGDLTLAGFTVKVRAVPAGGKASQLISVGPYPQSTIDTIAARVRGGFPGVRLAVVPAR